VADHLIGRGLPVVITGTAADRQRVQVMRWAMDRNGVCDLTDKTTLGVLGAVYRQAQLVVTNDSGPSHVAAAVRVPSVVVGSFDEPDRWAPLDRGRHRTVATPRNRSVIEQVLETVDDQLARWVDLAASGAVHQGTRTETLA